MNRAGCTAFFSLANAACYGKSSGIFLQLFVICIFHALHQEGLAGALVNQGAVLGSFPASTPRSMASFSVYCFREGFVHQPFRLLY
mmetsp:Transcript_117154/g.269006  ORF Transcript_117154/g.269006 Transcript_117154/m.269006 type:complete len:86 (+) Transcript_117154:132-389(+)